MFEIKILFFLLPFSMASQSITGKVYDSESTAKGIQVINVTQNIKTLTDGKGDFTIKASINDSLKFKSLFHEEKFIKISETSFNYTLVVELKKKVNALGEVLFSDNTKPKAFDPIDYTQAVTLGIAQDMKLNPHLYKPKPANGVDLIAVAQEIFKLFKNTSKETLVENIGYKTYDSLFSNDRFFNKKLLKDDLHITYDFKYLFFDYCDTQHLNSKFLNKQNQLILLDSLMHCSNRFQKIVTESKKQ